VTASRSPFPSRIADPADIAVVTVTMVRSSEEEQLLRRSLRLLSEIGAPIAIGDAGASAPFAEFLSTLPNVTVAAPAAKGVVPQVQAAFTAAAAFARAAILYTEPDKELFFAHHLRAFLEDAAVRDHAIVLAARSEAAAATFPPMQRYVESVVNHLCAQTIGEPGDYSYGPFVMPSLLAPHVARTPPDLGWGWRPFVFVAAHRRGLRVRHVVGDFQCPPDQRGEDETERVHRLRQLHQNICGLIA
jgi:hypothetical protein